MATDEGTEVARQAPATPRRLWQLEAARGFAAMYVFLHHYRARAGIPLRFVLSFSTAAVMVFFLLSGFVIYLSSGVESGSYNWRTYARKRAVRILPPYLVALVLAYVVDYVVRSGVPLNLDILVRNLLFTVESSSIHGAAGYHGNPPLWTLSYEVWFYVFFAVLIAVAGRSFERLRWSALALSVIGFVSVWIVPNPVSQYAVLLVVWWAGAELAHEWMQSRTLTFWGQRFGLAFIVAMMGMTGGRFVLVRHFGGTPYPRTALVQLLIAAVILVAVLLWYRVGLIGFRYTVGLFLVFGPISYGIYLFHYPIIRLATDTDLRSAPYLNLLWVVPAVLLFSWVFDYQLHRWLVRRTTRRAVDA